MRPLTASSACNSSRPNVVPLSTAMAMPPLLFGAEDAVDLHEILELHHIAIDVLERHIRRLRRIAQVDLRFAKRRCRTVHLHSHSGKSGPVLRRHHFGFADQRGSYRRIGADSGKLSGAYQCRDDQVVAEAPVIGLWIEVTPDEVHELQDT